MKIQVLGVKLMKGLSKESGNPFEMCSLFAVLPIEQVTGAKFSVEGYGYEVGEMAVEPSAVKQFESFKYPCILELTQEAVLYRGKITQVVTGTTSQPQVRAA
jgi:hypothetical protein